MRIPIVYWGFHDVPRWFMCQWEGMNLLCRCDFDEIADEYPDDYQLYLVRNLTRRRDVDASFLPPSAMDRARRHLGSDT